LLHSWAWFFPKPAIIAAASLLVVRSCGWRLVRGDRFPVDVGVTNNRQKA
jgi:hypothetical protein